MRPTLKNKAISIPLLGAALLLLSGCGKAPPATAAVEKVDIVATVYPLADVARQVGGNYVNVSWVIETGQSLAGYVPGPEVREQTHSANLILCDGMIDSWATEGGTEQLQHQRVLRLDSLAEANPGSGNYFWLDPLVVRDAVSDLSMRLQVLRPKVDQSFRNNAERYRMEIDALIAEFRPKFQQVMTRKVLVLNTDFNPLIYRFGLLPITTVDASPMQVSDAQMRIIRQAAAENGTRILLVPVDVPVATQRDLQVRGGLQIVPIDAYGSSAANGHDTYLKLMRFDLEQLLQAVSVQ